jgi:hypothetical protein
MTLLVARAQGARLARLAGVIGAARAAGLLTAKAPAETTSADPVDSMELAEPGRRGAR